MDRRGDLRRFYDVLGQLEHRLGGKLKLEDCDAYRGWPQRGVYFFFEAGQERQDSGAGPRVVRVGTHAVTVGSKSTLRQRLMQHRGAVCFEGGNHRGSIFRLLVGGAMKRREGTGEPVSWGVKGDPGKAAAHTGLTREALVAAEAPLEARVSRYIGQMPFVFLSVDDSPGQLSARANIEQNAIALLSNYNRAALDPPSGHWLGQFSDRQRVRESGLWNNDFVDKSHDPAFLDLLGKWAAGTRPLRKRQE